MALKNHPRVTAAELKVIAAHANVAQVRAPLLPVVTGNLTAVEAIGQNVRIGAGGLNNPVIFDRKAAGVSVNQLITDFGRSFHQLAGSQLRSQAESEAARGVRNLLLVQVSTGFYAVLQARSVTVVTRQTAASRRLLLEQIAALSASQLKSELDVSFARLNLQEAELLVVKSENDLMAAQTALMALLGSRDAWTYSLEEESQTTESMPALGTLIAEALDRRPELSRMRLELDAFKRLARAERALSLPTITAFGNAGRIPAGDPRLPDNYAAAGINVSVPIFTGGLNSARQTEAATRVRVAEMNLREEENSVARDVRLAFQNVEFARRKYALNRGISEQARTAFSLARSRYELGASSIAELSQSQLNQTAAEIAEVAAKYEYLQQRAILNYQRGTP